MNVLVALWLFGFFPLSTAMTGRSFQCVKANGEEIFAVTIDQVFKIDEASGAALEIPVDSVGDSAVLKQRALMCPAWQRGALWMAWTGRARDGAGYSGISSVTETQDILFDHLVSTRDWVFMPDDTFFVLGVSPDSDHILFHFDQRGALLASFLPKGLGRGKLADARIFFRDQMITLVLPHNYEAIDLSIKGEELYHYVLVGDSFVPRASFQDSDGTVLVELVSGEKKVTHDGIIFVNPGMQIAALRRGRIEVVRTLPPDQFPRQPIQSVVSGRLIVPPANLNELGKVLPSSRNWE